jgi:hypothetical protein
MVKKLKLQSKPKSYALTESQIQNIHNESIKQKVKESKIVREAIDFYFGNEWLRQNQKDANLYHIRDNLRTYQIPDPESINTSNVIKP